MTEPGAALRRAAPVRRTPVGWLRAIANGMVLAVRSDRFVAVLAGSLLALVACGDDKKRSRADDEDDRSASDKADEGSGEATLESVTPLLEAARAEGFETWPTSELAGIRVSLEVPPGERQNIYSVRVMFELDTDPSDATAKSGSVVCSPKCQVIRHKVDASPHPWPKCTLADATKAARKAGLKAKQPVVLYGSWGDGPRWSFKEQVESSSSIVIDGETCTAVSEGASVQPDKTVARPAPIPAGSVASVELERSEVEKIIQELAKQMGSLRSRGSGLRNVKEGSTLHKIGLRDGDVVKTINGFDFTNPDEAVEAYAKLRRAGQLDLFYERDGRLWTLPIKLRT